MYIKDTNIEIVLLGGILSYVEDVTTITIEDGICTVTETTKAMAYDFVTGASWVSNPTTVTSTIIPQMLPVPKSIYAIIEGLFMARTDAGCEEIPPVPAICATCPCKHLCDWLCTHDAI